MVMHGAKKIFFYYFFELYKRELTPMADQTQPWTVVNEDEDGADNNSELTTPI